MPDDIEQTHAVRFTEPSTSENTFVQLEENRHIRFVILALSSILMIGGYYCYDNPAYLNTQLQEWLDTDYETFQWQLGAMYSAYSLPNIALPFFGGALIDFCGTRRLIIIFSLIVLCGQLFFTMGVASKSFVWMIVGRMLLGIGVESLGVAQATFITGWFRGKECAFALGISLCVARIGNVLNDNLTPWSAHRYGIVYAPALGSLICLISTLSCCLLLWIDAWVHWRALKTTEEDALSGSQSPTTPAKRDEENNAANQVSASSSTAVIPDTVTEPSFHYPVSFWCLCLAIMCFYGASSPFTNISSEFLQRKWFPNDPLHAGAIMSVTDTLSAVMLPLFGLMVDRYGRRAQLLFVTGIVLISVHLMLGLTMWHPLIALTLMGLTYAMFAAAFWSSVGLLIPEKYLATAYGIATCSLNAALTLIPIIVAKLVSLDRSMLTVEMFFALLMVFGITLATCIWFEDSRNGSVLTLPERCVFHSTETVAVVNQTIESPLSITSPRLAGVILQRASSAEALTLGAHRRDPSIPRMTPGSLRRGFTRPLTLLNSNSLPTSPNAVRFWSVGNQSNAMQGDNTETTPLLQHR